MYKNNPPKNREFLGLVEEGGTRYWDFYWWATKDDGADASCFVDRQFFHMPTIKCWMEVPSVEVKE